MIDLLRNIGQKVWQLFMRAGKWMPVRGVLVLTMVGILLIAGDLKVEFRSGETHPALRSGETHPAPRTGELYSGLQSTDPLPKSRSDLPRWEEVIRPGHPRLFFNRDSWPEVSRRALGEERSWYDRLHDEVEGLGEELAAKGGRQIEPQDLGRESAKAAFVFLVTGEPAYLDLAKQSLESSIRFYEQRLRARRQVNWYATSRAHAVMAWDWMRGHMDGDHSDELMSRLVRVVHGAIENIDEIDREHLGSYQTGFYGLRSLEWLIGVTAYGTGIEPDIVNSWLDSGYSEYIRLLEHRSRAAGDDGGGASTSINYTFGHYPPAEQNFLYTWLSATGENIAGEWLHPALLANYVIWNWIESEDGPPLQFGYGDAAHTDNILPHSRLYTHMANIGHLYGTAYPEAAALAGYVQNVMLPEESRRWHDDFFIYPFLLSGIDDAPQPSRPDDLPLGRHFENMGQIFMRSGSGPADTYAMFACGGILSQHEHYDELHFTIYHRGFLALDSGTRYRQFVNGQHLANYYAQTVAHNNVLVHQPGEPAAPYWGGSVEQNHGGQHQTLGSDVKAFESGEEFVYAAGDGTRAYLHGDEELGEKVDLVTRQIVFIAPRWFVIFDRVTSTDRSYRKQWLLHTAHEPVVEGDRFTAGHRNGRLLGRTLLPADAEIELVGGTGREFWAAGRNWEIDRGTLAGEQLAMMGWGRVEVSPAGERTDDLFLHVLEAGDRQDPEGAGLEEVMIPAELIEDEETAGARLSLPDGSVWEIRFATTGELAGHVRRSGGGLSALDRPLTSGIQPQAGITGNPDGP